MEDVLEPSGEFLEANEISFSLLDICTGIKLDDKLLKVSAMVCLLDKNKSSKIHNSIFIIYFSICKKTRSKKEK